MTIGASSEMFPNGVIASTGRVTSSFPVPTMAKRSEYGVLLNVSNV